MVETTPYGKEETQQLGREEMNDPQESFLFVYAVYSLFIKGVFPL